MSEPSFTNCAECKRGGNGDRSCGAGWDCKRKSLKRGCFVGEPIKNKEVRDADD